MSAPHVTGAVPQPGDGRRHAAPPRDHIASRDSVGAQARPGVGRYPSSARAERRYK